MNTPADRLAFALDIRTIASEAIAACPTSPDREQAVEAATTAAGRIVAEIAKLPREQQTAAVEIAFTAILVCVLKPDGFEARLPGWARPGRRARIQARRGQLRAVRDDA